MEAVEEGVGELEEDTVRVAVAVGEAVGVNPMLAEVVGETERVEAVERDDEPDGGADGVWPIEADSLGVWPLEADPLGV